MLNINNRSIRIIGSYAFVKYQKKLIDINCNQYFHKISIGLNG